MSEEQVADEWENNNIEDDDLDDEEETNEKEGLDLFQSPDIDKAIDNPDKIINNEQTTEFHNKEKVITKYFSPQEELDGKVHPGFTSSYSFGEKDFDRLSLILMRLDLVAEKVLTYRKEDLMYLPEFYSILKNLYINIQFLIDTTNRKKINEGLQLVGAAVLDFTTTKRMNTDAIIILENIYRILTNLRNFHGLGISYEKKKGASEKFYGAIFKKKRIIG